MSAVLAGMRTVLICEGSHTHTHAPTCTAISYNTLHGLHILVASSSIQHCNLLLLEVHTFASACRRTSHSMLDHESHPSLDINPKVLSYLFVCIGNMRVREMSLVVRGMYL